MLQDYTGPMDVESIFSNVNGVEIGDGGNIQNMIVNFALAVSYAASNDSVRGRVIPITIASSGDPFERLPTAIAEKVRPLCNVFKLDIPDRFAIQVPYEDGGQRGTLAITSEPMRTNDALQQLLTTNPEFTAAFKRANCFVSADPIYDHLRPPYKSPPFATVINATTAFRSLVAAESFGRTVLLPMNHGEAGDVCKLLLQRGEERELGEIERPPFPSPLTTSGDAIDEDALRLLDESVHKLISYIPIRHPSIACPVSFGAEGGLVIGADHDMLACFTSTPSDGGEKALINEYGESSEVDWDVDFEVGAGDAVATIVALFNAVHPCLFIERHMEGRESRDRLLGELTSTVFVNVLARIAGNFLVRTHRTHWSSISGNKFPQLLDDVAKESLIVARTIVKMLHAPALGEVKKWGIKVVVWRPGRIAYPEPLML